VTNITDFGLFIEVEEGIEGLVHVSEVSRKKIKKPSELFKEGQDIQAKVIHVSADERRLGLSIKALEDEELKKGREFHGNVGVSTQAASTNLGDLLRQNIEDGTE